LPISKHFSIKIQLLLIRAVPFEYVLQRQLTIIACWQLVFILFCLFFYHIAFISKSFSLCTNLSTKHKFILFFLSVGKPKTVLKSGYSGCKGGSAIARLWFERLLEWAYKFAYDFSNSPSESSIILSLFAANSSSWVTVIMVCPLSLAN